jgi:hypothetical protein
MENHVPAIFLSAHPSLGVRPTICWREARGGTVRDDTMMHMKIAAFFSSNVDTLSSQSKSSVWCFFKCDTCESSS